MKLCEIIYFSKGVISLESGIMHLSSYLKKKNIVIHGLSDLNKVKTLRITDSTTASGHEAPLVINISTGNFSGKYPSVVLSQFRFVSKCKIWSAEIILSEDEMK